MIGEEGVQEVARDDLWEDPRENHDRRADERHEAVGLLHEECENHAEEILADNRGHQGENQGEDDGVPEPIVAKGGDEVVQRDELHGFRVLPAHGFIRKREIDRIDDRAEHENRDEQERGNHEEAAARREVIPERSPFAIGWRACWRRCDGIYGCTHE